MDLPFFVTFSVILLLGRWLPFALPPAARAVLAGAAAGPAATAKCAVTVAVAGLALLVATECSAAHQQQCPDVTMEGRALWLNLASLFLGMVLGGAAAALHPPAAAAPIVLVAVEHLAGFTETIMISTFAHDACVLLKILMLKQ
ncbi:hypothetical protein ACP4OV_017772 [Aristida adscensionis]